MIREFPGIVAGFLEHYKNSIDWVNEHPGEAGELAFKNGLGIPAEVAAAAIPRLNLYYADAGEVMEELQEYYRILYQFDPKATGGFLPDEDFFAK